MNPAVNISVAMAVKDGVVGAVIPNADNTAASRTSPLNAKNSPNAPETSS